MVYTLRLLNFYFQNFQTVFIKPTSKVIFHKLSVVKMSYLYFLEFQLIEFTFLAFKLHFCISFVAIIWIQFKLKG